MEIVRELDLVNRWKPYGEPYLVGSVALDLVVEPDIDLETLEVVPTLHLSTSEELRLPLRWIAVLHGQVSCSLAAATGVHGARVALKLLLAGADVTMMRPRCSGTARAAAGGPRGNRGVAGRARVRERRAAEGEHEPGGRRPALPRLQQLHPGLPDLLRHGGRGHHRPERRSHRGSR